MSTNTYCRHYVIHYIAKTLKVYDMGYRLQMWCFFVHKSLKEITRKNNDEIAKCEMTRKLDVNLWDAVAYLKLSFLKNGSP